MSRCAGLSGHGLPVGVIANQMLHKNVKLRVSPHPPFHIFLSSPPHVLSSFPAFLGQSLSRGCSGCFSVVPVSYGSHLCCALSTTQGPFLFPSHRAACSHSVLPASASLCIPVLSDRLPVSPLASNPRFHCPQPPKYWHYEQVQAHLLTDHVLRP